MDISAAVPVACVRGCVRRVVWPPHVCTKELTGVNTPRTRPTLRSARRLWSGLRREERTGTLRNAAVNRCYDYGMSR